MAMLRFGTKSFPMRSCQGGQIRAGVSQLRVLERLPHLSSNSRAELIGKMRAFFGIVGVFVGVYAYSTSAMAEGEEVSSQDESAYGYEIPIILRGLINNTIEMEDDNSSDLSNTDYYHINNVHIPDTVWSLDVSTGVHLDRISGGSGSATYAVFGGRLERTDFWSRAILGLWNHNITSPGPNLLITPTLFQVASCGGSSAEHSNLDYCDSNDINADKHNDNSKNDERDKGNSQGTDNNVISSNNTDDVTSSNNTSNTSFSGPGAPFNIAPLVPSNFLTSGDLTLLGQCDGVSISCAPIDIKQPAAPIDSSAPEFPTPPIDAQTPPIDDSTQPPIAPVDGPTPPVDGPTPPVDGPTPPVDGPTPPIDGPTPPIEVVPPGLGGGGSGSGRPIPEAPTWVMTAIGFCIVAFVFRRKKNNRINSISIIDNTEIY
jgi:hypothetical protein